MSSARGSNEDAPTNEYEQQKLANIAKIKERLESLNLPNLSNLMPPRQPSKRRKKTHHISDTAAEGHNLRPRTHRNYSEIANEHIAHGPNHEAMGDFLCDNEDLSGPNKKRKGRGITRLDDIFSRTPDMPKIKIMLNEYGQPVRENSRRLSSAIGCQVRTTLSIGCDDWRLVDPQKKLEVWSNIKMRYDIDDAAFNWFLATSGAKWKEFKAYLKRNYFDETLIDKELKARNGNRVNANDWSYLINFWRSDDSKARTARGKAVRSKLKLSHTSGSVSHASTRHNLIKKLGRPARRDEVFIKTHTRKSGVPLRQAAPIIRELNEAVEACPELMNRTFEEGDAYAVVCGVKEPKGRVRVLGLGPTPQEIGIPGLKSYVPTRIQMQVLARERAESKIADLEQRVMELQEQIEEGRVVQESPNVENLSQHGSNSRYQVSPRSEGVADESHHDAQGEYGVCADHGNYELSEEEDLLDQRHVVAPSVPAMNIATTPSVDDAPRYTHDTLVGKDVILYAMLRSDLPVAKGTIISTNPKTIVGGQPLGKQFCEVIVNVVMKRDSILPRPYDNMESMAGAFMMSIAWPYKKLKVNSKASKPRQGAAGTNGHR